MRKTNIFIVFTLILSLLCGTALSFADTTEKEYLDDKTYHHLDMGVYVAIKHKDGSWDNDKAYGGFADVTTKLTFPNPVEIVGVHKYSEDTTDSFEFDRDKGNSWNITNERNYETRYKPTTTKTVNSINANAEGKEVTLSFSCKLESPEKQNVTEWYNDYKDNKDAQQLQKERACQNWGGYAGLTQQASYDEGAKKIKDGIDLIFSGKAPAGYELDLVFIPIVIEYKILKPEGVTCERCGKCLVHGDTVCTEESCENYGTEECGCYTPPVITSDFTSSGTCVVSKTWTTHNHSHSYNCHTVGEGESAKRVCSTCYYSVTHTVKLELSNVKLTADKPMKSHKGNEVTFKSGYGFYVTGNAKTTYTHTSTCSHGRNPSDGSYTQPTKAYLSTNWTVKGSDKKSKYTQGKTVELAINGGNITTKENPISNYGKKLIYTDVELKGTKKNPVKHTVTLYVKGATVTVDGKQQELCASVPLTFWIKGNMYEDDYTVETR